MGVGDSLARWVYNNQPVKFAAIELVPDHRQRRPRDAAGPAQRQRHGQRRHPDPGPGLVAVRPEHGTVDRRAGSGHRARGRRPTISEVNIVHLAWDVMVGLGTLLFLLSLWWCGLSWIFRRRMPHEPLVPAGRGGRSGVLAVVAMEAGWIVTEVGRQPWIVYENMKVEDAATGNTGVWISFSAVVVLYLALGVTTILVLRGMSRRFRRAGGFTDHDAPLRPPSAPPEETPRRRRRRSGEHRGRRGAAARRWSAYAVFGGADFGAGFWDLTAGGPERGARPRARHRTLDRARVGSQPRLVDLHLRHPVDRVPRGVRLDHADAVRPADDRGPGDRAARSELRLPQGGRHHSATGASSEPRSPLSSVLVPYCMGAIVGGIASGRVPAGGQAGDPVDSWINPTSVVGGRPGRRRGRLSGRGLSRVGRPPPDDDGHGRVLPPPRRRLRHRGRP